MENTVWCQEIPDREQEVQPLDVVSIQKNHLQINLFKEKSAYKKRVDLILKCSYLSQPQKNKEKPKAMRKVR